MLMHLWVATLVKQADEPLFHNHEDLYSTINSTPLGEAPWLSHSFDYQGMKLDGLIPSWMEETYEIYKCNPLTLVQNILSNPDFNGRFDYAPYWEFRVPSGCNVDPSKHWWYHDFMSANWAWNQAVRILLCCGDVGL